MQFIFPMTLKTHNGSLKCDLTVKIEKIDCSSVRTIDELLMYENGDNMTR